MNGYSAMKLLAGVKPISGVIDWGIVGGMLVVELWEIKTREESTGG